MIGFPLDVAALAATPKHEQGQDNMKNDSTEVLFPGNEPSGPRLHNGAYTIAHEEHGHFTVKLYTAKHGDLAGKRIVALLQGPSNETDWKGVAFWNEEPRAYAAVWSKHVSPGRDRRESPIDGYHWGDKWTRVEQKLAIWTDLALRAYTVGANGLELLPKLPPGEHGTSTPKGYFDKHGNRLGTSYWLGDGYTLLLEGRCVRCNRKLTHPESIRLGIGPECRTKV